MKTYNSYLTHSRFYDEDHDLYLYEKIRSIREKSENVIEFLEYLKNKPWRTVLNRILNKDLFLSAKMVVSVQKGDFIEFTSFQSKSEIGNILITILSEYPFDVTLLLHHKEWVGDCKANLSFYLVPKDSVYEFE